MKQHPSTASPAMPSAAWPAMLLLLALLIGGCGFQPRGQALSVADLPQPMLIVGVSPYSALGRELTRRLPQAGASLTSDPNAAASVLRIHSWQRNTRMLSVDSRNKLVENELEEILRFSVQGRDRQTLLAEQTLRVLRIQNQPEASVLGSNREAGMLREDMSRELVERMLQRLAKQH